MNDGGSAVGPGWQAACSRDGTWPAEPRDEFEKAERRWEHARGRLAAIGKAATEGSKDVAEAVRLMLDEIRAGYQRVRKLL